MSSRWLRALAWGVFGLVVLFTGAYVVAAISRGDALGNDFIVIALPTITAVSALLIILPRPRNPIGWLLLIWAIGTVLSVAADIPLSGIEDPPATLNIGLFLMLWFQGWSWVLFIFPIFYLLQVFPTGRVLTPRWRWLVGLELTMASVFLVLSGLSDRLGPGDGDGWMIENPIGFIADSFWEEPFQVPWTIGLLVLTVGSTASIVVRYRRSRNEERQQVKWLVYAVGMFAVVYSGTAVIGGGGDAPAIADALFALSIAAIPVAIAVAVLRFRLFEIDVVISRTLVYGVLGLFITGVYVAIVVGWLRGPAGGDTVLSVVATAVVAIGFQGVRRWLQRVANRLVYGRRASPYQVLSDFSRRLAATDEGLIDQVARSLADGTSAQSAAVWVRVGEGFERSSVWPEDGVVGVSVPVSSSEIPGADRTAWVTHDGERLGALTLSLPRGQAPTPVDERLLGELASGMGLALRNAVLTQSLRDRIAELRESRRRIVAVQDQTRRRLERDLHDGAQQQLVALKVKLALARRLASSGAAPRTSEVLEGLNAEAEAAIQSMRDFARGIYPPLLESEGLAAAVGAYARKAPIPVSVDVGGIGRFDQQTETTVYFCIVEALQNTVKHSRAGSAHVALSEEDGRLTFTVTDDGTGFDPTGPRGHGLTNISDRLDAAGGSLHITTTPGQGTTLTGAIPVEAPVPT